jgi:riboflavin kinase/FMN adenylyltransferase
MTVMEELARLHSTNPTVITVGMFDGVHKGHQHLIRCLKESAIRQGCASGVITFTNHPRSVMSPDVRVALLTTPEDRLRLISEQGVDLVVPLSFTPDLSAMRARNFVELLKETLNLRGLVVGPNFAFGYQREGTAGVLTQLGQEMGFTVEVVEPVEFEGRIVSSTAVRSSVVAGDMADAAWMLSRPFILTGFVVEGDRRGRQIGFPTANLDVEPGILLPADGIYATWTQADGKTYTSATNIGFRPTFGVGGRQVETHLLDYSGDLYNAKIRVAFVRKLRDEMKFDGVESLVKQLHKDVTQAKVVLAEDAALLPPGW